MKKIIIQLENSGQRIDRFLKEEFFCKVEITRGDVIRLIKNGKVLVNNKSIKPSYILKTKDQIVIEEVKKQKELIANKKIKFKIIFENENFIIIDKPAGIKVHPAKSDFLSDNEAIPEETLASGLLYKYPEIENVGEDSLRPGIVHRLDKDTSGLMIIARNQKTFEVFKQKFKNREIEKKYLALVWGNLENKTGIIDKPIARATNFKKQVIAGKKTKTKIRSAVTHYNVIKSFENFDLVEVIPKTGRTHQIRVHFYSLGHPLVGDEKYKLKIFSNLSKIKKHLLQAQNITFDLYQKKYSFESDRNFLALVKKLIKC